MIELMKKLLLLLLLIPNLAFSDWEYIYGSTDVKDVKDPNDF
jgi:hypothetical protein